MRLQIGMLVLLILWAPLSHNSVASQPVPDSVLPDSLCAAQEKTVFSCTLKRSAKLVSLCASSDFAKERGYLQYRFGLPGKIELEFPGDRTGTQQKFHYSHYFRAQVDQTEISFTNAGFEYTVFDRYNGEEKPHVAEQGISVSAPGKPRETSQLCAGKAKADYSPLQDALPNDAP